jgi:hypothetical protein
LIDVLDAKGILPARFRAHMERVYHAIAHGAVAVQRVETHFIAGRGDGIRAMGTGSRKTFLRPYLTGNTSSPCRECCGRSSRASASPELLNEDNAPNLQECATDPALLLRLELIAQQFTTRLAPIAPAEGCARWNEIDIRPIVDHPGQFKPRIAARQRSRPSFSGEFILLSVYPSRLIL